VNVKHSCDSEALFFSSPLCFCCDFENKYNKYKHPVRIITLGMFNGGFEDEVIVDTF